MSIVPARGWTAKVAGEKARGLAISQAVRYLWGEAAPVVREFRRLAEKGWVSVPCDSLRGDLAGRMRVEALKRGAKNLTRACLHPLMESLKTRIGSLAIDFVGGDTGAHLSGGCR